MNTNARKQLAFLIVVEVPEALPDVIVAERMEKEWPSNWQLKKLESSYKIRKMAGFGLND